MNIEDITRLREDTLIRTVNSFIEEYEVNKDTLNPLELNELKQYARIQIKMTANDYHMDSLPYIQKYNQGVRNDSYTL